jgi:Protein of unknown function (DUF2878)
MVRRLVYFAGMQAAWCACVLGAAHDRPLLGPLAVLAFAVLHLTKSRHRWREVTLLAATGFVGYVFDSALVLSGVVTFPGPITIGWPSPVWMVALWVNLAVTLRSSLDWLSRRYLLAALVGAGSGPPAYLAGVRLGAAQLGGGWSLLAIAVSWAAAMPLLVWLADRTNAPDIAPGLRGELVTESPGTATRASGLASESTSGD